MVEAEVFISVLKAAPMSTELLNRITSNPRQCGGRPCIRGMRIRVKDILDMLAGGASEEEILADFPYLEPDDIRASLEYASITRWSWFHSEFPGRCPTASRISSVAGRPGTLSPHVNDVGLAGAEDFVIWDHALGVDAIIVTKDEDFAERTARTAVGPVIVWLRIGNATNRVLLE